MAEALRDKYANIMTFQVTETAAGALTFATVETNVGIDSSRKTGVAILIDEIDYYFKMADINLLAAEPDSIRMGLTISSGVTDIQDYQDRRILHSALLGVNTLGAQASGELVKMPMPYQFFPPLIMAERQIHFGIQSASLASAASGSCRVYYRTVQIMAEEFVEIAEVFRLVS